MNSLYLDKIKDNKHKSENSQKYYSGNILSEKFPFKFLKLICLLCVWSFTCHTQQECGGQMIVCSSLLPQWKFWESNLPH